MKKFGATLLTATMVCTLSSGVFASTKPTNNNSRNTQVNSYDLSRILKQNNYFNLQQIQAFSKVLNLEEIISNNNNTCKNYIRNYNNQKVTTKNETRSKWTVPTTTVPKWTVPTTTAPKETVPTTIAPKETVPTTIAPKETVPTTTAPKETVPTTTESEYASEVTRLVNKERANVGLSALTVQVNLQSAAQIRAKEQEQVFSHTRPNGKSSFTVLEENGVKYSGAGENIAMGQSTPLEVVNGWMNSAGHKANILNKNFTDIGIGYYKASNGTAYWAQLFTN